MTWFEKLTGFSERGAGEVRRSITVYGETLTSNVNGNVMACGWLETPTLSELRDRVQHRRQGAGRISVSEVIADVQCLHTDASNADSLFQVASQFNLLEMTAPHVTPELGVGIYERDPTQGPACAIAAGAGTIYRNYFVLVDGHIGQSENKQIDCLADLGKALGNSDNRLWQMRNGYALASHSGLVEISNRLRGSGDRELDELRKLLRIGIQRSTQVTLQDCAHKVSQAYCSALPVSYSHLPSHLWEGFARLVLEASYEATICSAIENWQSTGNNRVFLTLLGGGAFGNETPWILDSLRRALTLYADQNLDVMIVSYNISNPHVQQLVEQFS